MNRIVREHYPVAQLPEALREGFDETGHVRVTVEPTSAESVTSIEARRARLAQLFAEARPSFNGLDEIAAHIEALRREWD